MPPLKDMARLVLLLPVVEAVRRLTGLHRAAAIVRRLAVGSPRSNVGRVNLRRAIAVVDARFPDGGNCLRRSLLEIALDTGAAVENLYAGFQAGGGKNSGHAWLASHPTPNDRYDAVVTV